MAADSPTLRRRELAAQLRRLRHESGLTVEQVAGSLLCSPAKISRLETGQRAASLRDVRDLLVIYGVDDAIRERLMSLARESKERSWWQQVDHQLPAQYSTYIGLEAAATSLKEFQSGVVPGLLQTADYARALLRAGLPKLSPDIVEERLEVRLTRQNVLRRENPPRLWAILDEAVLHRPVGGAHVMGAQLKRLLADSDLPNVTVQVLPYEAGAHPGLDSVFIIVEFGETKHSEVVYVEGLLGQHYLERPSDLERYVHAFDLLRAMALSPAASAELISRVSQEYG